MLALEIKELKKAYKKPFSRKRFYALKEVSFSVSEGNIFGLIGPNGAGKTTIIKSILNLVKPTSGSIFVFSKNFRNESVRRDIGYMPETEKYPTYLTGRQFINMFFNLSDGGSNGYHNRLDSWIEKTGLSNAIDNKISEYSRGMRKRLGFIQAILHKPKLLLLDEPIEGLDTIGKQIIIDTLTEYREAGKTILINSHYLSEIEKICDHVAIIKQGKILMSFNPKNNLFANSGYLLGISLESKSSIKNISQLFPIKLEKPGLLLLMSDDEKLLNKLIHYLCDNGVSINRIEKINNKLEDIYLSAIRDKEFSIYQNQ